MAATIELAQTGKRDHLKALEVKYQQRWADERLFEVSAPTMEETAGLSPDEIKLKYPKWFGNFPYPYMNGSLHLGHAFTVSKIEFAAGYQRLLGKRVLFPHGFHVTGMPIKASSDKIIREMELFGQDFERFDPVVEEAKAAAAAAATTVHVSSQVDKAKKGKIQNKSTGHKYQFQIMESTGVPRAEIKKFADPLHWLKYYPPIAVSDHNAFGSRIDWRRAFLTTDANPYYDSFVRWQVNKLHRLGKIKFGERYTIYSPKDGQPCMDHDRQDGEGVTPQEYTGLKMEVVDWSPAAAQAIEGNVGGRKVYFVAATLRPETMYGQTNCFVGPTIKYGVFAINDTEAFVCTARAARNMAFQKISTPPEVVTQLVSIDGAALVGTKIKAPFGFNPEVYILPMDSVLATKGTGVVTSVPSDSPDDYATYADLRKKPEYYKVDPKWITFDPIPVISTPTYGNMIAATLCQKMKINSQKDAKQLAEAKEIAYKEGFYNGTMLVGEFKGDSVEIAKPKVRAAMMEQGLAFAYAEPEGLVMSRSQDECIVALMDQWYIDYGEPVWRAEAEEALSKMELYSSDTRHAFEGALAWLKQWACARTYGLGSQLPWDPQFLVESLSDSTMYMAYYTVAQLLHGDIEGKTPGLLNVSVDEMTDEVWEYILAEGPWPSSQSLPQAKADAMKHEYSYFYPFDIRSSAKDLITNNLSFLIYTHIAVLGKAMVPHSMRTNGHLLLNGMKMSKSTGNSLTMKESVEKFGADATRLSLADAGDGIEDANFDELTANANILRVHTLLAWCEEMVVAAPNMRTGEYNAHDRVFIDEVNELINVTQTHYEATNYKDALKFGFYELQSARDWYREVTADVGMHGDLVKNWIRVAALLVVPIAPHFAEHIHSGILNSPTSIQLALWPTPSTPVDRNIIESSLYMRGTIKMMRDAEAVLLKKLIKAKGKGKTIDAATFDPKKPKSVRIYVATAFPQWQDECVEVVRESYDAETGKVDDAKVREILQAKGLIKNKLAMPFVQAFKKRMAEVGAEAAFRRALPFDEAKVLSQILPYLVKTLQLQGAEVLTVEEARTKGEEGYTAAIIDSSEPGEPGFEYRNVTV